MKQKIKILCEEFKAKNEAEVATGLAADVLFMLKWKFGDEVERNGRKCFQSASAWRVFAELLKAGVEVDK